ncbi:MAG TPA: alpha/beta hydrolase fold domain-containing protein [Solirubrobacteraceae bacterium]|nr:alpha/beta hydrolase fold domain-containing protein [Solirubrobacteraceae bacterium]
MRVIIAGGGTGGLATALALRQRGIEPLVLEQSEAFAAIGAGLGLQPNAMKAITGVGGDALWRSSSARIDEERQHSLTTGELITRWEIGAFAERYGEHYYCGHRADLLASLLEPLPSDCVRLSSRVVGFEEGGAGVAVQLDSGEEVRGDVLIGADGLRSATRRRLFGEEDARFTGVVVWRGLIRSEDMPEEYRWLMLGWYGPHRHVLVYPLRHAGHPESLHMLTVFVPVDEVERESWTVSGDLADLRASLSDACDAIQVLLDCMPSALITGIYFRDPLERWSSERVTLVGDAAHPVPPNAGQGAGMALEDAVMLGAALNRHRDDVADGLAEYERRRRVRVERVLESSRVNLLYRQLSDPAKVRARDGYFKGLHRLSPASPLRDWFLIHDPVAAAAALGTPAADLRALKRPQARRAFDLWRSALSLEDRCNGWLGERAGYAAFLERETTPAPGARTEEVELGGVEALRIGAPGADESTPIVLHLHGGAYSMGAARSAVALAARLAAAAGGVAVVPDYRLAPEHPYPAALEDVVAVYAQLRCDDPRRPLIVTGECAGGGIALSLLDVVRAQGSRQPDAVYVVSPFCDLTVSEAGFDFDAATEPWLDRVFATQLAAAYVQSADTADPRLSPLLLDCAGFPPLLIHAAAEEAALPGAAAVAANARAANVDVRFRAFEDSVHSFVLFDFLPETETALEEFAALSAVALERAVAIEG